MASNIIKLTDYDGDTAHFESFNRRIHILTINDDNQDGITVSIDIAAARRLVDWLKDTIGPNEYYTEPTIITEFDEE